METNLGYSELLSSTILPNLMEHISNAESGSKVLEISSQATLSCIGVSSLKDSSDIIVQVQKMLEPGNKSFTGYSEDVMRASSFFVCTCIMSMFLFESDQGYSSLGEETFFGCSAMVKAVKDVLDSTQYWSFLDVKPNLDAMTEYLKDTLSANMRDCTCEEYIGHKYYEADLKSWLSILNCNVEEKPQHTEVFRMFSTQINITAEKICKTYTDLFSSAYEVIKPVGLLTNRGTAIVKEGKLCFEDSFELRKIYEILSQKINLVCEEDDFFNLELLVSEFKAGSQVRHCFYKKLLEFLTGCVVSDIGEGSKGVYKTDVTLNSWGKYQSAKVKPLVIKILQHAVITYLKVEGLLEEDRYKEGTDSFDSIQGLFDFLYHQLTSCIITSDWREVILNKSDPFATPEVVGYKFRISDTRNVLPLTDELDSEIVSAVFQNRLGDSEAVCGILTKVGAGTEYSVVDLQHKFRANIVDGEPLFAYTALRSLQNSGREATTWQNLILGKRDDDSILSFGKDISMKPKFGHLIMAGSRAGKGVMTLNMVAGAIASGKPIFYIDSKPDMASLFRSERLSGGKMFCINGAYIQAKYDRYNNCAPENFSWKKHLPKCLREDPAFGENYSSYDSLYYYRALMFVLCLCYVRGGVATNPELYNALGGEDGIVIVLDEISHTLNSLTRNSTSMLSKNGSIGSRFYSKAAQAKARRAREEGKPIKITEVGCYCTDLLNSFNSTSLTLSKWLVAGFVHGEEWNSDMIVLGQELESLGTDVTYTALSSDEGGVRDNCNGVLSNLLFSFSFDAYFGYNQGDKAAYMAVGQPESPASTRLTESSRNFCYLESFDKATNNAMCDARKDPDKKIGVTFAKRAKYFKPFLILNDADEGGECVKDLISSCEKAGISETELRSMHTNEQGVLQPEIGFIPYIEAQSGQSEFIQSVLEKSYTIANTLVKAYLPNYTGDCIDFIYDLSPECMFTADSLLDAYLNKKTGSVAHLTNEFFGSGASSSGSQTNPKDGAFNDYLDNPPAQQSNGGTPTSPQPIVSSAGQSPVKSVTVNDSAADRINNRYASTQVAPTVDFSGASDTFTQAMQAEYTKRISITLRQKLIEIFDRHPNWKRVFSQQEIDAIIDCVVKAYMKE